MDLEQKQQYLRANIDASKYEDFYEFCEREAGNTDITAWNFNYIQQLVKKFKKYEQSYRNRDLTPYNEYQSHEQQQQISYPESSTDFDDCKSSVVLKSSAVDLFDEVFESYSMQSSPNNPSIEKKDSVSFEEFDFWTNGCISSPPKNQSKVKRPSVQPAYSNLNPVPQSFQSTLHNSRMTHSVTLPSSPLEIYPSKGSKNIEQRPQVFIKPKKIIEQEQKPVHSPQLKGKWILQENYFHEQLQCFRSAQRTQLNHPNLNVFIDEKHEIIQRSLLAPDYPMYKLKVIPIQMECKRNYDDFQKLKKALHKFFPGIHLPYLEDNSWFNGTEQWFIRKQKKMIEMFMRDLLRNPQIRNSRVMEDFLVVKDHKTMKRKFEKYEDMAHPKGIQELCLLAGKVEVAISNEQTNYITHLTSFIKKMDDYYSRHRSLTQAISKQYNCLIQNMNSMIRLMGSIEKQIKDFNSKVTTNQLKYLGRAYHIAKQTYKEDFSNLKFDYEINNKKLSQFLKYEHENMLGLQKLIQSYNKMHKGYEKRLITEKISPDDGYNSEKARSGKEGILEESKNIIVLKYQVGYLGNQCRLEGNRVFDEMGYKLVSRWQSIASSYIDRYKKNIKYCQSIVKMNKEGYFLQ